MDFPLQLHAKLLTVANFINVPWTTTTYVYSIPRPWIDQKKAARLPLGAYC